jgi:hypothetical protein
MVEIEIFGENYLSMVSLNGYLNIAIFCSRFFAIQNERRE